MNNLTKAEEHQFHQLLLYFEHHLLLQKCGERKQWVFSHRDPTWQALCHCCLLALKSQYNGEEPEPVSEIRQMISAGTAISGEPIYPLQWDYIQLYAMRHPEVLAFALLEQHASHPGWSETRAKCSPIPLTSFTRHLAKTKTGNRLVLSKAHISDGLDLLIFDDGQFQTAVDIFTHDDYQLMFTDGSPAAARPTVSVPLNHPTLDLPEVREEVWRRCWHRWNDSEKMANPPEIQTEDNLRVYGSTILAASVPELLKNFDQVRTLLEASLTWKSPRAVQEAVFALLRKWVQARHTSGFNNKIGEAWGILPDDLRPYFL